jgi:penicillin-binding protein 1A
VTLWQAAVLAGLPRAPSRFNPRVDPDAARARARQVLAAMMDTGTITAAQSAAAERQMDAPDAFPQPPAGAGWFADWVAGDSADLVPEDADALVRTTLDSRLELLAETRLAAMLDGPGAAARAGQGAVVILDAETGAVRAMVGGRDRGSSSYNRAVLARRQPGSAFKPFVWLAALERGLHPDDTVEDAPLDLGGWSPHNFDGRYRGTVTLEQGLAQSLNTVAVRLAEKAGGPTAVAAVARRLGIDGTLPDNLTIALGTANVGVMQLTAAYAPFCNSGLRVAPMGVEGVRAGGRAIVPEVRDPRRVIGPEIAAEMRQMLGAVVAQGTGRAAAVPGRGVAGKTGTTQDSRDAWFVGCVGGDVMGVWLGNDDDTPMNGVLGGTLPARLFHDIALGIRG